MNLKKLNVEEETKVGNAKAVMRVKISETLGHWVKEERQKRKGKSGALY
jgi:hypothetical protein